MCKRAIYDARLLAYINYVNKKFVHITSIKTWRTSLINNRIKNQAKRKKPRYKQYNRKADDAISIKIMAWKNESACPDTMHDKRHKTTGMTLFPILIVSFDEYLLRQRTSKSTRRGEKSLNELNTCAS